MPPIALRDTSLSLLTQYNQCERPGAVDVVRPEIFEGTRAAITELRLCGSSESDEVLLRRWMTWREYDKAQMSETGTDFAPLAVDFIGLKRVVVRVKRGWVTMGPKRREVIKLGDRKVEIVVTDDDTYSGGS